MTKPTLFSMTVTAAMRCGQQVNSIEDHGRTLDANFERAGETREETTVTLDASAETNFDDDN